MLQESSALACDLAERWREPPEGSVVYADLTVRKVMPAALEKHLSEQPCHFPSQMSDERRSIWVWDLPFPIQIDGRRYRCRTCAANGASMRYYVITVSDLQAAFPDLLTWRDRRHGTVFFTKKFLLYLVQVFYRRLNVRATKRAIVEQIGASALALGCMTRLRTLCTAIPSNVSLRKILLNALEGYTSSSVKRLRQHINLYAGTLLRHDGNYDIPERVVEFSGGVRRRPHGCLVAFLGVDGSLLAPPELLRSEALPDLLPALEDVVDSLKADRLQAGMALQQSCPIAHATDSYQKQRLALQAFYRQKFPELHTEVLATSPKADAAGAARGAGDCCVRIVGDPVHACLALQRCVSAASPDARNLIADHKALCYLDILLAFFPVYVFTLSLCFFAFFDI